MGRGAAGPPNLIPHPSSQKGRLPQSPSGCPPGRWGGTLPGSLPRLPSSALSSSAALDLLGAPQSLPISATSAWIAGGSGCQHLCVLSFFSPGLLCPPASLDHWAASSPPCLRLSLSLAGWPRWVRGWGGVKPEVPRQHRHLGPSSMIGQGGPPRPRILLQGRNPQAQRKGPSPLDAKCAQRRGTCHRAEPAVGPASSCGRAHGIRAAAQRTHFESE